MNTIIKSLLLICFLGSTALFAQSNESSTGDQTSKNRELGIKFLSLSDYNLLYKVERKENRYLRLGTGNFNIDARGNGDGGSHLHSGLQFDIGFEKRLAINDRLTFLHGLNPGISYAGSFREGSDSHFFKPSLGYILGAQYSINESFNLAVETIPMISDGFFIGDGEISHANRFRLDASNRLGISFTYKFKK